MSERWHGTRGGYSNHRCRCTECREAHRVAMAAWKAQAVHREPYRHDAAAYRNWGCRCEICTAANSAASRKTRQAS